MSGPTITIPVSDYHADEVGAAVPSLSASIAHVLCTLSPWHAWTAHPKLNPDYEPEPDAKYDLGTAAHALLLEGEAGVTVIDAPDFRTKEARLARDAAYQVGRTPLLSKDWQRVQDMAAAIRDQLDKHEADPPLLADGKPEQTLVWQEPGDVVCRARLDWLRDDLAALDDLKTTSRTANPDTFSRTLFGLGYDVKCAFYVRGVQELTGETPQFRWIVAETSPPYAVSVIAPGPAVLTIGGKKVLYALDVWRRCLRDGRWPGWPTQVCYADLPAWEEASWLERELREAAA